MTDVLIIIIAILAAILGLLGGVTLALYQQNKMLQNWISSGQFRQFEAQVVPAELEAEDRALAAMSPDPPITPEAIARGADELLEIAKSANYAMSRDEAERHAEQMLEGNAPL